MEQKVNQNIIGLNLDAVNWQLKDNQVTWALNANIQSHDGNSVTYTNEPSNTKCYTFDTGDLAGFQIVGLLNIVEQSRVVLFLSHPDGRSRIGSVTSINDDCLDVVTSEKDCGCKEGYIITESTVVEDLPPATVSLVCPEGFEFNPDTLKCEQISYALISTTGISQTVIESCVNGAPCSVVSTHGSSLPRVYDSTWTTLTPPNYTYVQLPTPSGTNFWQPGGIGVFNIATYLKDIGIQADLDPTNPSCRTCHTVPTNDFLGFSETICISETKEYYLAVAADDSLRVTIDGVVILDIQADDPAKRLLVSAPTSDNGSTMWSRLNIFPITISAGSHLIKFEYKNSLGIGMFAYELYDISYADLTAATLTKTYLQSKRVVSNGQVISSQFKRPVTATPPGLGASFLELDNACPEGYTLVVGENCAPICKATLETDRIEVTGTSTCCQYEDLVLDNCLEFCPNTCSEYVLGFRNALISVEVDGEIISTGTDYSSIEKYYEYEDCNGNKVNTFLLGGTVRFTARNGTLRLLHNRLYVIQETDVNDTGTATFSKENCCLNFDPAFPVHAEYRIDNCETKIYYTSRNNPPRMFSIEHPYGKDACGVDRTCIKESCEDSKLFPAFCQPELFITAVNSGGNLRAGVYSFSVAYCDEEGNELTDYLDLTNPIPIYERSITEQTEYNTSKSINVKVFHKTRIFEYFNLVVAETIDTVTNYYLVNTFRVNQLNDENEVLYSGDYRLPFTSITPIIRSPYYATASIIEKQNDILMLADLEETPKYNFQPFASNLELFWETVSMPADGDMDFSNPEVAYFFRTFQRDEVYAFGIKFKLKNGKYSEVFHIPGRRAISSDLTVEVASSNDDVFLDSNDCSPVLELAKWQVYNTAEVTEPTLELDPDSGTPIEKQYNCKIVSHKRGKFSYWESTETYPCYEEVWEQSTDPNAPYYNANALGGQPIRHHKFPDSAIVHIHDNQLTTGDEIDTTIKNTYTSKIYPIGVRIDKEVMEELLNRKKADGTYAFTVYDPIFKKNVPIKDLLCGFDLVVASRVGNKSVVAKGLMYDVGTFVDQTNGKKFYYSNYPYNDLRLDPYLRTHANWYKEALYRKSDSEKAEYTWDAFSYVRANGNNRFTFYSPDTCFQFPKLGTELKLETVEFGHVLGHFAQVDEHPRHRIKKDTVYYHAGIISAFFGINVGAETDVSATVAAVRSLTELKYDQMIATEQIILDIVDKLIPLTNHAWQYNSIATYNQFIPIGGYSRKGSTKRLVDLGYYANEKIVEVYDDAPLHNRLRETSVYFKTTKNFPVLESQIVDNSRYLASSHGIDPIALTEDRVTKAMYASVKRPFFNQYGTLENLRYHSMGYSLDVTQDSSGNAEVQNKYYPAFGGDTFINKFALKRKHSFFTRNLVNLPARVDEYAFDYFLFPNLGYPTYYLGASSDPIGAEDVALSLAFIAGTAGLLVLANFAGANTVTFAGQAAAAQGAMAGINAIWTKFNTKVGFDDEGDNMYHRVGKFYTASYGIPIFFVESDVNIDFRHGRNEDRDNFYPNAGGGVPDEWLQERTVPIKFDNFFYYNASYSVVNLSPNTAYRLKYPSLECLAYHPNRVIYSDQASKANFLVDPWRNYRPGNFYDFPKQGGKLIDLNAGDQERVYARFENTTKVYNARIVLDSTSPYQLEIGNADMFKQKPIDLKSTDTGYIGTQHRAYVRCEYGTFWVDAKRGHVYQLTGDGYNEIKNELNYNWFKENLPFQILKDLPEADVDSPALGIGIVMGWDERYERVFITKLDYRVKPEYRTGNVKVVYDNVRSSATFKKYLLNSNGVLTVIRLGDAQYFENKSWTAAYSPKMKNFISFYSFLPNFYIPQLGHFQTAINTPTGASLWNHGLTTLTYQTYYNKLYPYIIEYSVNTLPLNSQLTSVSLIADIQEYYNSYEYYSLGTANNKNVANFTKAIVYNREQSSGVINLIPEKFGDKMQKVIYPRVTTSGIETILSRRENRFTFNGFWNLAAQSNGQSLWTSQWADIQTSYPIDKLPNTKAIRNLGLAYQKNKIKSEFTRVRLIQDKYNRYKFVNHIQINQLNTTNL